MTEMNLPIDILLLKVVFSYLCNTFFFFLLNVFHLLCQKTLIYELLENIFIKL